MQGKLFCSAITNVSRRTGQEKVWQSTIFVFAWLYTLLERRANTQPSGKFLKSILVWQLQKLSAEPHPCLQDDVTTCIIKSYAPTVSCLDFALVSEDSGVSKAPASLSSALAPSLRRTPTLSAFLQCQRLPSFGIRHPGQQWLRLLQVQGAGEGRGVSMSEIIVFEWILSIWKKDSFSSDIDFIPWSQLAGWV